jgi:hypothetical protein
MAYCVHDDLDRQPCLLCCRFMSYEPRWTVTAAKAEGMEGSAIML